MAAGTTEGDGQTSLSSHSLTHLHHGYDISVSLLSQDAEHPLLAAWHTQPTPHQLRELVVLQPCLQAVVSV
jgi:hypothetical protein